MDKTVIRLAGAAIVAAMVFAATALDQTTRIAVSIAVGLPSFVLMIISRRQLGKSFTIMPQAKALVTTGLYSKFQHPMYVFLDLVLAALIVASNWYILLFAWGILVGVQTLQSRKEEQVLAAGFGTEYESYRSRTWL